MQLNTQNSGFDLYLNHPHVVVHAYSLNTWKAAAEGSEIQGHNLATYTVSCRPEISLKKSERGLLW